MFHHTSGLAAKSITNQISTPLVIIFLVCEKLTTGHIPQIPQRALAHDICIDEENLLILGPLPQLQLIQIVSVMRANLGVIDVLKLEILYDAHFPTRLFQPRPVLRRNPIIALLANQQNQLCVHSRKVVVLLNAVA